MTDLLTWTKTHCGRLDHGGCTMWAGVKDGKIIKIKGDPKGFLNRGYMCVKGLSSAERLNHPKRLTQPLMRSGKRGSGQWKTISWREAIERVCEGLSKTRDQYGARAVAFCQGMPKGLEHFVLIRLANLFGSPNVVAVQDVCHAPREIAGLHTCGFYPVVDFRNPGELVVLWGSNATATHEEGNICRPLLDAVKRGTRLIIIDPRKTRLHRYADQLLQIRPGSDSVLAMAFLHVIIEDRQFDAAFVDRWVYGFHELAGHAKRFSPERVASIIGVSAAEIRRAAHTYAGARPAAIAWGNAIEQNQWAFDTARSLVCLMALCGNLDIPGGNIQPVEPDILGLGAFVRADLIPEKQKQMLHAHHRTIPRLMTVPGGLFRKAVLEKIPYPVRAAYLQCTNPIVGQAGSRGMHRVFQELDFIAVADIFMTPTAAMADVVLPAATQFEFNDIGHYGLGHGYLLARPKVVDAPGACRSDMQILTDIGKTVAQPQHWPDHPDAFLNMVLEPAGLSYQEFTQIGWLRGEERFQKYLRKGFRTPTGKVEFVLSRSDQMGVSPLPTAGIPQDECTKAFPLLLTCGKDSLFMHSSYRWVEGLRRKRPFPRAEIHPDTAMAFGVCHGEPMVIETRNGRIVQHSHVTESIRPGVVLASPGWWYTEEETGKAADWQRANYNMLTSADLLGRELGTPNLRGIACRIRAFENPRILP